MFTLKTRIKSMKTWTLMVLLMIYTFWISLQSDQSAGSLKEELSKIIPQLEEMKKRKIERRNQFLGVVEEIQIISSEINGSSISSKIDVDETDLSLRRLEELHRQLHALQTEKVGWVLFFSDHTLSTCPESLKFVFYMCSPLFHTVRSSFAEW